jgi:hypothetical protein
VTAIFNGKRTSNWEKKLENENAKANGLFFTVTEHFSVFFSSENNYKQRMLLLLLLLLLLLFSCSQCNVV